VQRTKLLRYIFWGLWFGLVPLVLAWATVELLKSDNQLHVGVWQWFRYKLYDQWVPALIVFFTAYEMVLYHWRHQLPLARETGVGGRIDVPVELRREVEQALQLLDETARLRRRSRRAIERHVPGSARAEIDSALEELREELDRDRFDADRFAAAHEQALRLVSRHFGRWRKSEVREYAESIVVAVAVALLLRAFVVEAFKIPSGSMLPTLQIQDHIFVYKLVYGPAIPFSESRLYSRLPPKRGDVMVFEYPGDRTQDFIKRAIAIPGDRLLVKGGHPFINDWMVPYCYVGPLSYQEGNDTLSKRGQLFIEYLGDYSYLTLFEQDRLRDDANFSALAPGMLFQEGVPSPIDPAPHDVDENERMDFQGPYQVQPNEVWVLGDNRNNSSDSRAWNHGRGGGVPFPYIKGRAMFVWLSFGPSGGINPSRLLHNVMGKPTLPKDQETDALRSAIDQCLAQRPSVTLPPPPTN